MMGRGACRTFLLRRSAAISLSVLAVVACGALPESDRTALETVEARMPAEIAGFMRGDVLQRQPNLLAIDYATPNRSAVGTVLIYETGGRAAPSDPEAPGIDREVSLAVSEVTDVPPGRTGRRLEERERITITDPGLRCAVLEGSFGRAPLRRHICVGGAEGRFVKVEVTTGAMRANSADQLAFASGVLRAVRGR